MSGASPHAWSPPPSVVAAGERARVRYGGAVQTGDGVQLTPSPALVALRNVIVARVRGVPSGGMVRPSDRRAGVSRDPHRAGIALDIMLAPGEGRAALGDALANLLVEHAEALGLQYVLWSRREWSASSSGARWEAYTGSDPHVDHIHVELGPEARAWSADDMRARAEVVFAGGGSGALVAMLGPWLLGLGLVFVVPQVAAWRA